MGCTQSAEGDTRLQTVDDSVHVMLAHDKKVQQRKGQQPHGYVPRAEHPLLKPKTEGEEGPAAPAGGSSGAPAGSGGGTDQGTTTTNGSGSGQ